MTAVGFSRVAALNYLEAIYLRQARVPADLLTSATGSGGSFGPTSDGIADAVNYAADLDGKGVQGVYHRVTLLRDIRTAASGAGPRTPSGAPASWSDHDFGTVGHKKASALPPDADAARKAIVDSGAPDPTLWSTRAAGSTPCTCSARACYIDSPARHEQLARFSVQVQDLYLYGAWSTAGRTARGLGPRAGDPPARVGEQEDRHRAPLPDRRRHRSPGRDDRLPRPDRERMTVLARELVKKDPTAQIAQPLPEKKVYTGGTGQRGVLDVIADLDWDEILPPRAGSRSGPTTPVTSGCGRAGTPARSTAPACCTPSPTSWSCTARPPSCPPGRPAADQGQGLQLPGRARRRHEPTARALIDHEDPLGLPASVFDEIDAGHGRAQLVLRPDAHDRAAPLRCGRARAAAGPRLHRHPGRGRHRPGPRRLHRPSPATPGPARCSSASNGCASTVHTPWPNTRATWSRSRCWATTPQSTPCAPSWPPAPLTTAWTPGAASHDGAGRHPDPEGVRLMAGIFDEIAAKVTSKAEPPSTALRLGKAPRVRSPTRPTSWPRSP